MTSPLRNTGTPDQVSWEQFSGRGDPEQRYAIYRLCEGERELLATAPTPAAVGVALVALGRDGELEGCPVGLLDREGAVGHKWLIRPWLPFPTPKNVSDAGRTLRLARKR